MSQSSMLFAESVKVVSPASRAERPGLPYAPGLDGLRAIAVGIVFASHTIQLFGGMLGVDIFFVLSGFLITNVLVIDAARGVPLHDFYRRRFLRLVPALTVVSLAVFITTPYLKHTEMRGCELLAPMLWVANLTESIGLGCPYYMGHTWSLAIEEQFYLLWPAILLVAMRKRNCLRAFLVALGLAAACALWRAYLMSQDAPITRLYFPFETRCDGLLIGAAAALWQNYSKTDVLYRAARRLCLPAATALAYIVMTAVRHAEFFCGLYTGVAVLASIIIVAISRNQRSLLNAVLGFAPLVYLGKLSYSFYLWHFPVVIATAEFGLSPQVFLPVTIGASLVLAALTYHLVETPFLRLRHSGPASHRLGWIAAFGSVTAISCGLFLYAL